MKRELIVQRSPKSPVAEVFRTLRTNIQFMNSQKDLKTLFSMTPYFYRTSEADKAKLDNVENIELTASFIILEYVKEG